MYHCIIGIGSNYHRKENILIARKALEELFPSIRFSSEQETKPFMLKRAELFTNQVAIFVSDLCKEELTKRLKAIERSAGRCNEDVENEKISLDIDLLSFDGKILKPADMAKDYIIEGIKELNNNRS